MRTTGAWGEDCAAHFLTVHGWTVLARNVHSRWGEIDIIACDAAHLLFVEVKTRSSVRYGTPAEAVTSRKQEKLILTAQTWMQEHPTELQPRFDIIEVRTAGRTASVRHIEGAFEAEL